MNGSPPFVHWNFKACRKAWELNSVVSTTADQWIRNLQLIDLGRMPFREASKEVVLRSRSSALIQSHVEWVVSFVEWSFKACLNGWGSSCADQPIRNLECIALIHMPSCNTSNAVILENLCVNSRPGWMGRFLSFTEISMLVGKPGDEFWLRNYCRSKSKKSPAY